MSVFKYNRICLFAILTFSFSLTTPGAVSHVLHITVDGLGGYQIKGYLETNATAFPNFKRLQKEGACTFNARCDYDYSETVPNHVTVLTARPVEQPAGITNLVRHGYSANSSGATTIHNYVNPTFYKASTMDVVHDNGLKVAIFLGKTKLAVCTNSYNNVNGAQDLIGEDNGKQKYDLAKIDSSSPPLLSVMTNLLATNPPNYLFFHFVEPDTVGHSYKWNTPQWSNSIITVDNWLGQIFRIIDSSPILSNDTAIVLCADHGGGGDDNGLHMDPTRLLNYTIPIFVKGPGFEPDSDLYQYFSNRFDPGTTRPEQAGVPQPLHNGDTGNIALMLLGLPEIPDSYWRPQYKAVSQNITVEILKSNNRVILRWLPQSGYLPVFAESLTGDWSVITNQIQNNGTHNYIEITPNYQLNSGFYRLKKN